MSESSKDDGLVRVKVAKVGFADEARARGVLVLSSDDGLSFPIGSFSGEVADYLWRFKNGDRTSIPSIYKMISEFADMQSLFLTSVEIFERNGVMRANVHFVGKEKTFSLQNYRASDSIALATFYDAPIFMQRNLLRRLSE